MVSSINFYKYAKNILKKKASSLNSIEKEMIMNRFTVNNIVFDLTLTLILATIVSVAIAWCIVALFAH